MKINWLLIGIIAVNLIFSTLGDICAKLWGITNHQKWLYIGLALNLVTILAFMGIVRTGGLAIAATIVLIITIIIGVMVGHFVFGESIFFIQWVGIVLGLIAIPLILGIFYRT